MRYESLYTPVVKQDASKSYLFFNRLVHDFKVFLLGDFEGGLGKVLELGSVDQGVVGVGGEAAVALAAGADLVRDCVQHLLVQRGQLKKDETTGCFFQRVISKLEAS